MPRGASTSRGLFAAAFYAMGAPTNAGFSFFSDGLMHWSGNPVILLTIAALTIFGGLGYVVVRESIDRLVLRKPPQVRWTPDGKALAYVRMKDGVGNVWKQPIDGGQPVQVTHFPLYRMNGFDWAADFNPGEGDHILLAVGTAYTVASVDGQAVIDLGNGDALGLAGVAAASFDPGWIVFN